MTSKHSTLNHGVPLLHYCYPSIALFITTFSTTEKGNKMSGFIPTNYNSASPARTGGMAPQTQYIFPILKTAEILSCCAEVEVELTKAELTEPQRHRERVRKVLSQFLDLCFGISEEELAKQLLSPEELKEQVEFPELHEDHLMDVVFFRELSKAMRVVGVYDFSFKDLYHPVAKRFRVQMSALINMAKFREDQLRKYYELMEPRNELVNALSEVHNEHELLVEQLQKAQQESSVKMEEIDAVARECQELESDIAKSNKLQASKREEAAVLKREVNDLKDQLASTNWALQEAEAEMERLKGQIVSSPARRKRELADKEEELQTEKEEGNKLEAQIEEGNANKELYQKYIKSLEEMVTMQKQVLEEATKHKKALEEIEEVQKKIDTKEEELQGINEKTDDAERELMRLEEKLQQSRKQGKMEMDAAVDRLELAKEQLLMVEKERSEGMNRIEEGEAEVRELEEQMQVEKEQTEREIAALVEEYKETERAFLVRHEKRMDFIEAAMS